MSATETVMLPTLPLPWQQASRIVGERGQLSSGEKMVLHGPYSETDIFFNDSCLIKDRVGRWHCIGIAHRGPRAAFSTIDPDAPSLYHSVGERIDAPYTMIEPIVCGIESAGKVYMYSPYVVWKDEQTALMFYSHYVRDGDGQTLEYSMRVLESDDPKLERWAPSLKHGVDNTNFVFTEDGSPRDSVILRDQDRELYLWYYVVTRSAREEENLVRLRTSADLVSWSDPITVMTTPPGYVAAESIFILKRGRYYYLWVCGVDYGCMSLYVSEDPLSFGHAVANRVAEQSGHAPEIAQVDGQDFMACVAISSTVGNRSAEIDLPGVYVQPIKWVEADRTASERVVRLTNG